MSERNPDSGQELTQGEVGWEVIQTRLGDEPFDPRERSLPPWEPFAVTYTMGYQATPFVYWRRLRDRPI